MRQIREMVEEGRGRVIYLIPRLRRHMRLHPHAYERHFVPAVQVDIERAESRVDLQFRGRKLDERGAILLCEGAIECIRQRQLFRQQNFDIKYAQRLIVKPRVVVARFIFHNREDGNCARRTRSNQFPSRNLRAVLYRLRNDVVFGL